jgi:dimeric dUTPase (all-alpha-NTP-PPase superfamily)
MFIEFVYKVQEKLNKYIFKKHEKRLVDYEKLSKTDYKQIDWDQIGNEMYDIVDLTRHLENRQKNCIMYCNAIMMEVCELIVALGFKWWSTDTKNWLNVKESAEAKHITEEYIDILHFVISLGHALGLTTEQIMNAYSTKNEENFNRQDRNY